MCEGSVYQSISATRGIRAREWGASRGGLGERLDEKGTATAGEQMEGWVSLRAVVQGVHTRLDVRSWDISTALKGLYPLAAAGAAVGGRDGSQPCLSSSLRVFQ